MQLQLDDTWAIIATSTDLYVKLHPHHLYQLRTSSFALATTQNQTTHHMPIAGVEAFALCATDAAESKSMQVDVASIKLHVSLQLIHVALRFAAFVLSVPAVSPESVSPRLSSWGDGCIVAATMRCSLVEVWILPPTEKISGVVAGVASNNPPTAFALATLNQATMEGLWQHQAVQHARAAVSQVFLSIDQTTVVQIAPTPTTPQGVTLLLRQSASLDSAFSVHTICGVLDIVYPPEALCQGITHAKTYVDLLRRNTSSLPFTSISNRTPSEGTPQLQAPHPPTTAPPSLPWRLTLDWQMDLVTVLLCQHKKPFVKYHFYNMAVQAKMLQASTSPCLSSSTFVDLTVYRMYLQDLTDTGVALHRDVVVPTQQPTWTLHGLQVTCLWRLYIELWNYMYHPSGGVELVTTHYRRTFSRTYDNVERSSIRVVFDHVAFCFPRNGTSIDMLAMVMNECVFTKSFGTDTWTYDQAMGTTTEATLSVDNIDQPLPTDGDRQKNCLAMTQVSLYCADTESVVQRHWSFRRGTHSPEVPPHSPPTNMESLLPPLPPPLASIIEGGPMYLDPNIAWKRVTVAPFDFTFVRDFGLDECSIMQTRDLFVIQPSLRLNLELTELSILLSLWYDNMGEYPQFPSPFEPPTNYCDAYTAGPHPHFAPFTSPSQVPADLLTSPHWEVGFVLHAMEIRLPLHDHEFLAMQLRPVVVKVYGCVDSTFMRCAVVTDRASLVKRGAPGVPPAVLADLGPGDRRPFVHDNINVFDPFDRGVKTPAFGMQFSMVRFPYGYTMMGLRLDQLTVGLFSDPDVLAFVVEFFSTYFYDSEYGYPWPLPDAIAPHVGVSGEYGLVDGVDDDDDAGVAKEMLLLELVYSEVIVVHTPCLVLTANDRVFQIQSAGSSAGFGWQLFYEWTATDASLWVHLPGVEAHFIDSNKTTTAPSLLSTSKPATTGTPRTVLTPVTIDSTYAFNMLTWQQSSTFNVTRYDVAFPHEDDLTVFVYCVPSDIAFFAALVAAYETSLGDSSPSAPAPPASTPDGSPDDIEIDGEQVGDDEDETAGASCQEAWTSWSVHLPRKVGIVLLDDMLLFQKPVLQLVLCEVGLHVLQCHDDVDTLKDGDSYHHANDPQTHEGDIDNDPSSLAIASTLAVFAKLSSSAQVDVFNNIVRAWEPLVEPFHVKVLFEHNGSRIGVSITTPDSVQINITESFVNAVLESWGPQPRASVGLVNWTGKSVRYFQPQPLPHPYDLPLPASADPADGAPTPHRPLMVTYVRHPPLNPARGGSKADGTPTALACPPILSVLVGRHKVETTVLNQNDLDVLFASVHQHSHHTDAFRLALCGDATAELTYDMSVQLFGFQWLHHLDLNQSGYFFFDLVPEIPHVTMTSPPLALSSSPRGGQRALPSDAARTPMNESSAAVPLSHLLEPTAAVRAALRCLVHVDKIRPASSDAHRNFIHTCQPNTYLCVQVTSSFGHATKKGRWSRLFRPTFSSPHIDDVKQGPALLDASQLTTLTLHPPLTLQNLLCVNIVCCVFRHLSGVRDVVWEGTIKAGGLASIYASNLADNLYCSVLLPALQCETVKPALLHVPSGSKIKYKQDTRHFEVAGSAAALARRHAIDDDDHNKQKSMWMALAAELELQAYLQPPTADKEKPPPSATSPFCMDGRCSFATDSHDVCYCAAPTCAARRLGRFATMFSFGGGGNTVGFEDTDLVLTAMLGATAPVATPKVPPTSLMADHTMAPLNLVRVHTRMCGPTYVTLLRQVTRIEDVSYRIDNQTASHVLYYRQVGVESPTNGWKQLAPGKSTVYVWAEPLALHQLAVCLRHEDAATRPSPRHIWTTRATKLNALLLSARKQQPHNETTMLHLGGGYVPTNAQSRQKHYYYQQAKQFGYASALVSERKGLGLDDVESIHLDVIGLQMALNRPSPTTTASSIGTNLHSFPPTSTDAPPSDVVSKPFLPKLPKRTTSCARIDNDGVTRVLRVRDTTSLDDEKRTFVHEEARVQRLLLQLLALQSGAAFATVHTSSRRARRDMSPSWEESSPRSSTVRGGGGQHCRRTATDCVSLRAFASSLHTPPPPMNTIPTSSDRNTRHTISRSLRTSSCVVDTNRSNPSAKRGGPVGPDSSSNSSRSRSGEGRVGLTLFQSMDHPTETTTTNNAEQALYEQMVSFMTSPVLEDVQQVLVQVVCASGLKAPASEGGGWSNPYGIVTLLPSTTSSPPHGQPSAHTTEGRGRFAAMASSKLSSSMLKRMEQKTYYIERTLDPVWRDQAFLFEKASAESACSIQIDIRSHSPLGKHVFLGRAVVEVGGDDDDNITKHVTVKLAGAKSHHVVTGTVGVVVQMARTRTQLLEYWYQRLRERMQVLSEQLVYIRSRLRQIDKERALEQKRKLNVAVEHHHAKQQAGRAKAKALLLENKAKLVAQKNKLKDKWTQQLQQLQHPSVHMNEKFAHFRDAAEKRWMSEVKKLHKANVRTSILHVKRLFAKESHASSATATSSTGTATKVLTHNESDSMLISLSYWSLDYCGSHGGTFCAWFPVTPLADTSPVELDLVKLLQPVEMKLGYASPPSSSPCVQVTMTYEPEQSSFVLGRLQSYVSVFVGELAVSLSAPVPVLDTSSPPNHSNSVVEAHEILRISCSGIEVKCLTSSKQCQWTIDMDSFQVDNQRNEALNQTELPVMVSRTISSCSTSSTHDMTSAKALKPVLQAVVVTRRLEQTTSDSHGPGSPGGRRIGEAARHMTHIELVALSIEETDWTFDEVILRTLYDVCERLYEKHQPLFGGGGEGATSTPLSVAPSSPPLSTGFSTTSTFPTSSVYIARLEVRPFKCNITFRKSTTYALNTSSTSSSSSSLAMPNLKSKFLHSFLAAVLNIANTIENAPLEFNALRLDHEITDLHHPYAGLTSGGGTGFVRGLTKGTASLLGHTTFGLFDTTSRMTGAMGNSVAAFSGDRVFKAKRNVYALARPTSRRDQLRLDVKKLKHDVFSGIVGGLTGLVMDPIRGGRRGGWRGLVGGVAQGFTGVVVKPVVGAMDFATHMVEGVRDVAGLAFETKQKAFDKHRKRMSHVFGADGRLLPHDAAGIWSTVRLVVVRKCEVLCAEVSTAHWQQPRLVWRVLSCNIAFVERTTATKVIVHFRARIEDHAKPYHPAPHRKQHGTKHHQLSKHDDGADNKDELDTVEIATTTWEDVRHFERDEAKMNQLVAVLRQQYSFVDACDDNVIEDVADAGTRVVVPPRVPGTSLLQQFSFERLHKTQETLKTQYCINDQDECELEQSAWTDLDGHDAAMLWAGCMELTSSPTTMAEQTKKAKTRPVSFVAGTSR
ncbi:hypothetical protein B5M09_007517 [Aphanomyces astaci]|uniref:C2 domain-containing protein n=1 Tax=Aphanomyces astaci TaxID=112090 RepID=A0A425CX72_APHAT|nr:hypothetical protein B5M09_007517 [Aphanomyces astaci]